MYQSVLGVPRGDGSGSAAAPSLLANGVYWQSGLVTATPYTGQGWIAGLPGLSSGASVSILRVVAAAAKTGYSVTATYNGTNDVPLFQYWDGAAYQDPTNVFEVPFGPHVLYSQDSASATFDSQSASAWLIQMTESVVAPDEFEQADAFTVS